MKVYIVQQLINFRKNGFFSKEDNWDLLWSKIYDSWKLVHRPLLPVFLENSEPKTGQEYKFWQFWNELL